MAHVIYHLCRSLLPFCRVAVIVGAIASPVAAAADDDVGTAADGVVTISSNTFEIILTLMLAGLAGGGGMEAFNRYRRKQEPPEDFGPVLTSIGHKLDDLSGSINRLQAAVDARAGLERQRDEGLLQLLNEQRATLAVLSDRLHR